MQPYRPPNAPGYQQPGMPPAAATGSGQGQGAFAQHSGPGGESSQNGVHGQIAQGLPGANGLSSNGNGNGNHAGPSAGLNGMLTGASDPGGVLPQAGSPQPGDLAPAQPGLPPASMLPAPLPGQPLPGQPAQGQLPGRHSGPHDAPNSELPQPMQPNGFAPVDHQRSPLPQRQSPPPNGMPYAQDRPVQYGQLSPAQLPPTQLPPGQYPAQQLAGPSYPPAPYGAPQPPAVPQPAVPVGDAVQSAHAEGYGFGEAVARDAPALWLEAVLARKPRMPSDLEARLLQGSALPIDSLLHDEVRHALRRGFWDALERSRR